MVYILYLVLGFYIFYFILANRLASPFYSVFPFLFGPFIFIRSPHFIQSLKTNLFFICHPFAPAATAATFTASSRPRLRPRFSIDRRLFVPAKCVRNY